MQNLTNTDYKKMSIDESFKAYKCNFLKAVFIKLNDNENTYQKSCIITKILKLDKNNQHGYAITKSLPTGCIKGHPSPMARVQPPS